MNFAEKHKRLFLLLGMAVCLAAIIFTAKPGFTPTAVERALGFVLAPLQKAASSAADWVGGRVTTFREMDRLRIENEILRQRNSQLEIDHERLLLAEEENLTLNALLDMHAIYTVLPKVGARVIGKDANDWYDSYNIDKGADDGFTPHMAVIGIGGLAGVVREVYPTYSKVVSVIDSRCRVAVMNRRTEDQGVVRGDIDLMPQGLCRMDYIEASAQIMVGDELVTSAHSSFFPPGILVGKIIAIESDNNGLTQYAIVEPAAQVRFVETVLVVTELFGDENEMNP